MENVKVIGVDLAKNVFQVHGVGKDGQIILRKQLRRAQMLGFFQGLPPCLVGIEACGGAHYWARELARLGHEVRLMPPSYVKAYVKRGKTDAADAEAICEAVTRPSMRFVPVKSAARQAVILAHRARDFLVRQLTQISNAFRAHLCEFGIVAAKGVHNIEPLITLAETTDLPDTARLPLQVLAAQWRDTKARIDEITQQIRADQRQDEVACRLATIPAIGPLSASILAASLADISAFRRARDLAAWIGLTPRAFSTGGKQRLGRISKMGDRYIRRLLYLGAMARISARKRGRPGEDWLWRMLERKPVKVVAIALANRMARTVWALLKSGNRYDGHRAR